MNTPPHLKCFQFFFSWIIFVMTSGSMCASLKKGTTCACPENGKTHSRKTRFPVWGTSTQRFLAWGAKLFCWMSQIRQNSFPENTFRHFGHCCNAFWRQIAHFLSRRYLHFLLFTFFESIYDVIACVPKKFRKLPSARRIFPKVFRRSHFWTSNSCPFP